MALPTYMPPAFRLESLLGAYHLTSKSGVVAAGLAGNSEIYQWRWAPGDGRLCLIQDVVLGIWGTATAFAAGEGDFHLTPARGWSAAGTGGTAIAPAGNDCKLRTDFPTSAATARISATGALGAGTKTLDALTMCRLGIAIGTATSVQLLNPTSILRPFYEENWPLLFKDQEGFVVRATVPATGTWNFTVGVRWLELAAGSGY